MHHPATAHLYGGVDEGWTARVYADAILVTERQLAYARRLGRTYSQYAVWAERLERELIMLKQLAENREGSWTKSQKMAVGQSLISQK